MALRINTSTGSSYSFPLNLLGVSLYLRITFNTRSQSWYLDILNETQQPIELGVKLYPYQPLVIFGKQFWSLDGNLFVMATKNVTNLSGFGQIITRDNFGGNLNYQLYYVPSEEYGDFGVSDMGT